MHELEKLVFGIEVFLDTGKWQQLLCIQNSLASCKNPANFKKQHIAVEQVKSGDNYQQ